MKKNITTSRELAINILADWATTSGNLDQHTERYLHGFPDISSRERQLTLMLIRGTLRQLEYLDLIIRRFSTVSLARMKPLTLMALRIGTYQLIFLNRIPDSAAINETIKALKRSRQPRWLTGFVNGVLRRIAREKTSLPAPDRAGKNGEPILNHPPWLLQRWQERYGQETAKAICMANNTIPILCLRSNTRILDRPALLQYLSEHGIQCHPGYFAPDSIIIEAFSGSPTSLPGFAKGYFLVQDEAAQLAGLLLSPASGVLLDACAGLGGKTTHLSQRLQPGARLVAVEPDGRRFALLRENLQRLRVGREQVTVQQSSLEDFAATTPERFNGILLDVPCSGTGVIRRHPEIRWNRQPTDLKALQELQCRLLETAVTLLHPDNSILVYCTCSLEREENEDVIDRFLSLHRDFQLDNCAAVLPKQAKHLVDARGLFHALPSQGLDGFFGARLVRRSGGK